MVFLIRPVFLVQFLAALQKPFIGKRLMREILVVQNFIQSVESANPGGQRTRNGEDALGPAKPPELEAEMQADYFLREF